MDFEEGADALEALELARLAEVRKFPRRFLVPHALQATTFRPGEPVLDTVTGMRGHVVHTHFETVLDTAPRG